MMLEILEITAFLAVFGVFIGIAISSLIKAPGVLKKLTAKT